MKTVVIITENFIKPWGPNELEEFLGGSQECVVLLGEALNKIGYNVYIYSLGPTKCKDEKRKGILYRDYSKFNITELNRNSTIILFKTCPFSEEKELQDHNIIYWSSDIEDKPQCKYIKKYICLTNYHKDRINWNDAVVIPHGIDITSLNENKTIKIKNTALYCSSLDRGFKTILKTWSEIKKVHPELKIYVTYGFKLSMKLNPELYSSEIYENKLRTICEGLDINYLGNVNKDELEQLYWRCEYWLLPLEKAESELFCFNAIKSQYCGCIPIVYKKGALLETVGDYIDYDDFVKGNKNIIKSENKIPIFTWDEIVLKYWKNLI